VPNGFARIPAVAIGNLAADSLQDCCLPAAPGRWEGMVEILGDHALALTGVAIAVAPG
jgi:hypothetical protein